MSKVSTKELVGSTALVAESKALHSVGHEEQKKIAVRRGPRQAEGARSYFLCGGPHPFSIALPLATQACMAN